jgi:hypothetical protein
VRLNANTTLNFPRSSCFTDDLPASRVWFEATSTSTAAAATWKPVSAPGDGVSKDREGAGCDSSVNSRAERMRKGASGAGTVRLEDQTRPRVLERSICRVTHFMCHSFISCRRSQKKFQGIRSRASAFLLVT